MPFSFGKSFGRGKSSSAKSTIKSHIANKHGKRISSRLDSTFGFGLDALNKALKGDLPTLQKLATARDEGALVELLAPMLNECYNTIYGATSTKAGLEANIITSGAKNALAIDQSVNKVLLSSVQYMNARREMKEAHKQSLTMEKARHQYTEMYTQVKALADMVIMKAGHEQKVFGVVNSVEMKQLDADRKRKQDLALHYLTYGADADPSLVSEIYYEPISAIGASKASGGILPGLISKTFKAFGI